MKRRSLTRQIGNREFRKYYLLATEGSVTEPEYFNKFNKTNATIKIECIHRTCGRSSPRHVLSDMKKYLRENAISENYEVWLIIDRDDWSLNEILELHAWAAERSEYNLAISDPNFEYWILLHYEEGTGCTGKASIKARLNRHIQGYDKHVRDVNFKNNEIQDAVTRGRQRDLNPADPLPHGPGSRVYLLADSLLKI